MTAPRQVREFEPTSAASEAAQEAFFDAATKLQHRKTDLSRAHERLQKVRAKAKRTVQMGSAFARSPRVLASALALLIVASALAPINFIASAAPTDCITFEDEAGGPPTATPTTTTSTIRLGTPSENVCAAPTADDSPAVVFFDDADGEIGINQADCAKYFDQGEANPAKLVLGNCAGGASPAIVFLDCTGAALADQTDISAACSFLFDLNDNDVQNAGEPSIFFKDSAGGPEPSGSATGLKIDATGNGEDATDPGTGVGDGLTARIIFPGSMAAGEALALIVGDRDTEPDVGKFQITIDVHELDPADNSDDPWNPATGSFTLQVFDSPTFLAGAGTPIHEETFTGAHAELLIPAQGNDNVFFVAVKETDGDERTSHLLIAKNQLIGTSPTPQQLVAADVLDQLPLTTPVVLMATDAPAPGPHADDILEYTGETGLALSEAAIGTTDSFTIALKRDPDAPVAVRVTPESSPRVLDVAATGGEFDNALDGSTTLVFLPGDFGPQTVTLTTVQDTLDEGTSENVPIEITVASPDQGYDNADDRTLTVAVADDDETPSEAFVFGNAADVRAQEGGVLLDGYTLALAADPGEPVTVTVTPEAGEVTVGLTPAEAVMPFLVIPFDSSNYQDPVEIFVQAVDDAVDEESPEISAILHEMDAETDNVDVSVTDNDAARVTISDFTATEGNAGTKLFTFFVNTTATERTQVITYGTFDGTATTADADYVPKTDTITFGSAQPTSQSVTVTVNGDTVVEPDEGFTVQLTGATNGAQIADGIGQANIKNDDGAAATPASVTITESGGSTQVTEGGAFDSYTLTLGATPTADVTITITHGPDVVASNLAGQPSDGSPFVLTFPANAPPVPQVVRVIAFNDAIDEATPHGDLIHHAIDSGDAAYDALTIPDVDVAVSDDAADTAKITTVDVALPENHAGDFPIVVSVTASEAEVKVDYQTVADSAEAGTDYVAESGTLTFAPSQTPQSQTITVDVIDDAVGESSESFLVLLTNPVAAQVVAPGESVVTIQDNDALAPGLNVVQTDGTTIVTEGDDPDTLKVSLKTEPVGAVTVTIPFTAEFTVTDENGGSNDLDGDGFPEESLTLVFTPTNWQTEQIVQVHGTLDSRLEFSPDDDLIQLVMTASAPLDADYEGKSDTTTVLVNDGDKATISWGGGTSVTEGGLWTGQVGPNSQVMEDRSISFQYATVDGTATTANSDYAPVALTTLTWGTGEGGRKSVTVQTTADTTPENNENFQVVLSNPDPITFFQTPLPSRTITINNDDLALVFTHTDGSTSVKEGDAQDEYTVHFPTDPGGLALVKIVPDADVKVTSLNGVMDSSSPTGVTLVFAPGMAGPANAQTVTVQAVDDRLIEVGDIAKITHTITIVPTPPATSSPWNGLMGEFNVPVTDNEVPQFTISGGQAIQGQAIEFEMGLVGTIQSEDVTITFDYATAPGTATSPGDFTSTSGTISIGPGEAVREKIFVPTIDDNEVAAETFTMTISNMDISPDVTFQTVQSVGTGTILATEVGIAPETLNLAEGASGTYAIKLASTPTCGGQDCAAVVRITPSDQIEVSIEGDEAFLQNPDDGSIVLMIMDDASHVITVTAIDDGAIEGPQFESITHTIDSADPVFRGIDVQGVTVNVQDDDEDGVPQVILAESAGATAVVEGGSADTYTIRLGVAPTGPVALRVVPDAQVAVSSESAVFTLPDGSLVLQFTEADYNEPQTVSVLGIHDEIDEAAVHAGIIGHVVQAPPGSNYQGVNAANVIVAVSDHAGDIAPAVVIEQSGGSTIVTEGTSGDSYTIRLATPPTAPVAVRMTVTGEDIEITDDAGRAAPDGSVTLVFTPEDYLVAQTLKVIAVDDTLLENAEFDVIHHEAASADFAYHGLPVSDVQVPVVDNDVVAEVLLSGADALLVSEAGVTDTYTIKLSSRPAAPVLIVVTPDAEVEIESDGAIAKNPNPQGAGDLIFVFTPNDYADARIITVTAVDDEIVETSPHDGIISAEITTLDSVYRNVVVADVVAKITDNDAASLSISDADVFEGHDGTVDMEFDLVLTKASASAITVTFNTVVDGTSATPGTDYVAAVAGQVTIPARETEATLVVVVNGDVSVEGPETFKVVLASAPGASIGDGTAVGTIKDDDGLIALSKTAMTVAEGGTDDSYDITLLVTPTRPVTITVTAPADLKITNDKDLAAPDGSVTLVFTSADTPQTIKVKAADDTEDESSEDHSITHSAASADAAYSELPISNVDVTVLDNDGPKQLQLVVGDGVAVTEGSATVDQYDLVLSNAPDAPVTVTLTPDDQVRITAISGLGVTNVGDGTWRIVYAVGGSLSRTVSVAAIDDSAPELDHKGIIEHAAASADVEYQGDKATLEVQVADNDVDNNVLCVDSLDAGPGIPTPIAVCFTPQPGIVTRNVPGAQGIVIRIGSIVPILGGAEIKI